jgi:hypothetical protein
MATNKLALFWALVLTVVYLFFEIAFNATLVSTIAQSWDQSRLESIETYGRSISATGAVILVLTWLMGRVGFKLNKLWLWIIPLVLIWASVFHGQKKLVEHYIVEPSDANQRRQAFIAQVLKNGLLSQHFRLQDSALQLYNAQGELDPAAEDKVYLAFLSTLVFLDPTLGQKMETASLKVLRNYLTDHYRPEVESGYLNYVQGSNKVQREYDRYVEGQKKKAKAFNDGLGRREKDYKTASAEAEQQLEAGWKKYQNASTQYESRMRSQAQQIRNDLRSTLNAYVACKNDACRQRQESRYTRYAYPKFDQQRISRIALEDWLLRRQDSTGTSVGSTLLCALLSGKKLEECLLRVAQGAMGVWVVTDDPDFYYAQLYKNRLPGHFEGQVGLAEGIQSFDQFAKVPTNRREVATAIKKKTGLIVPADWYYKDQGAFYRAWDSKFKADYDRKAKNMDRSGLPDNLSESAFYRHEKVQARYRSEMGDNYVRPTVPGWSRGTFEQQVFIPRLNREVKEIQSIIKGQTLQFADGGKYEVQGKDALRASVVPAISAALSLFMILLSLSTLPAKLMAIFQSNQENTGSKPHLTWVLKLLPLPIIVLAPFFIFDNKFVDGQEEVTNYLYIQIERNESPLLVKVLDWALRTQPKIQPVGENFQLLIDQAGEELVEFKTKAFAEPSQVEGVAMK